MNYTKEQKIKIFESLPQELKDAIMSVETSEKLRAVTGKNSLMLDQATELGDEVGLLMLGITKQKDFLKNIEKRLEINEEKALAIAKDVNTEILDSIRESLRKIQEQQEEVSASEPVVVEQPKTINTVEPQGTEKQQMISSVENAGNFTVDKPHQTSSPQYNDTNINRDALLKHIEGAEPAVPLVDHLLTTPVSNPQVVEVKNVVEEKKSYSIDPYKEQI